MLKLPSGSVSKGFPGLPSFLVFGSFSFVLADTRSAVAIPTPGCIRVLFPRLRASMGCPVPLVTKPGPCSTIRAELQDNATS